MKAGDVILLALRQADGKYRNRPALLLKALPPYGDWLACGISSQVRQTVPGFDEIISPKDPDYATSGIVTESVIRLGFIASIPSRDALSIIGQISTERHQRLIRRLSDYLLS